MHSADLLDDEEEGLGLGQSTTRSDQSNMGRSSPGSAAAPHGTPNINLRIDLQEMSDRLHVRVDHLVGSLRAATGDFTVVPSSTLIPKSEAVNVPAPGPRYAVWEGQLMPRDVHPSSVPGYTINDSLVPTTRPIQVAQHEPQQDLAQSIPARFTGWGAPRHPKERTPLLTPAASSEKRRKPYKTITLSQSPSSHSGDGLLTASAFPSIRAGSLVPEFAGAMSISPPSNVRSTPTESSFKYDDDLNDIETLEARSLKRSICTTQPEEDGVHAIFHCDPDNPRLGLPLPSSPSLDRSRSCSLPPDCVDQIPNPPKRVKFLSFEGSPISDVHVYEATDVDAIVMDIRYARPRFGWIALILSIIALSFAAAEIQHMQGDSDLTESVASSIMAWWTSLGQAVMLGVVFPCVWVPTRSEVKYLKTTNGKALLALLAAVMCFERSLGQLALSFVHGGSEIPAHVSISQYPLVLVIGRAMWCKRVLWVEVAAVGVASAGMALVMLAAYQSKAPLDSAGRTVLGITIGLAASCLSAGELVLIQKLRGNVTVMLMVTCTQALSCLGQLPLAVLQGASAGDIFGEITKYSRWRYIATVITLCIGNVGVANALGYHHPVTIALALTSQSAFVLPFVVPNTRLLGPGYLIGITLVILGSAWGGYLSAKLRRNVSIEVPMNRAPEEDEILT